MQFPLDRYFTTKRSRKNACVSPEHLVPTTFPRQIGHEQIMQVCTQTDKVGRYVSTIHTAHSFSNLINIYVEISGVRNSIVSEHDVRVQRYGQVLCSMSSAQKKWATTTSHIMSVPYKVYLGTERETFQFSRVNKKEACRSSIRCTQSRQSPDRKERKGSQDIESIHRYTCWKSLWRGDASEMP